MNINLILKIIIAIIAITIVYNAISGASAISNELEDRNTHIESLYKQSMGIK